MFQPTFENRQARRNAPDVTRRTRTRNKQSGQIFPGDSCTALQSQKAATAHLKSQQLLSLVSARHCSINMAAAVDSGWPSNTRHCPNVGSILGHRLRRWSNIEPTLGQFLIFAGWSKAREQTMLERTLIADLSLTSILRPWLVGAGRCDLNQ